jgi:hypothetical protein
LLQLLLWLLVWVCQVAATGEMQLVRVVALFVLLAACLLLLWLPRCVTQVSVWCWQQLQLLVLAASCLQNQSLESRQKQQQQHQQLQLVDGLGCCQFAERTSALL